MKAVVIGGGIAGLTVSVMLLKNNWEVVVCEKSKQIETRGHAFLMDSNGMGIIQSLDSKSHKKLQKAKIDLYSLKRPNGEELIKIKLDPWYCIKRIDLIDYLYHLLPNSIVEHNRVFSHFIYANERAVAAVFENGTIEYGDIFIGSDGSNSKVREAIFGPTDFTPMVIKEIVGVSSTKLSARHVKTMFQKIQHSEKGLSFGYIPTNNNDFVWFMQYDIALVDPLQHNEQDLKSFCYDLLKEFPIEVKEVLDGNDFSTTYIWNTRDFDLLPSFNKNNIVLIGDAAHLALPFTSAGTTNALHDAKVVTECLLKFKDPVNAFSNYYHSRASEVKSHLEQGRAIKELFLNPLSNNERNFLLPLISSKNKVTQAKKPLKILYFTDPICSTCWVIQPILRKLQLEYDDFIEIEYRMGGLLPSWVNFNRGNIANPNDVATHWEDVSQQFSTPIDGDVWIEDPLESSFPPSIAFKAAQLQSKENAVLFLSRLKEMVFIEKKNITKTEFIEDAALKCGLDAAVLLKDIRTKAVDLFLDDLRLAQYNEIKTFPTLFFINETKNVSVKGLQTYEKLESIVTELLPDCIKKPNTVQPEALFQKYNYMTEMEFSFLMNCTVEKSQDILNQLNSEEIIEKYDSKNGLLWRYKDYN